MISILKTFGLGLLCTLLSPLILLVLILYFFYTLIGIIVMFFISVYRYFAKGGNVLDELEVDKKARQILQAQEEYNQKLRESMLNGANQFNPQPTPFNQVNSFNNQNAFYGQNNSYNQPQTNPYFNQNAQNNPQYSEDNYQNQGPTPPNDNNPYGGDNL